MESAYYGKFQFNCASIRLLEEREITFNTTQYNYARTRVSAA